MWFLWALLLGCLTLAAIDRAASLSSARTAILGAVAGPAWLIGLWDLPEPAAALIGPAVAHFPFLCLGAALGAGGALRLRMTGVRAALAACAFVAALILVLQHDAPASPAWGSLIALVLSLAGCAILRHVTVNAPMNPLIGTFAFLGQGSLAIYVAHTIFSAPTREALLALGVDGLAAQLVLGTLAGLLGPIALLLAARTTGISRVAGLA
jgi:fucose 4-O-acetylase-like acetyltransferase